MSSVVIESDLSNKASHIHQALASLQEEQEAIDFYNQRADVTSDEDLKAILEHNRNDEMEHAMMLLEWLRRNMPDFDTLMRKFLFTSGPITTLPTKVEPPTAAGKGLGLGNFK